MCSHLCKCITPGCREAALLSSSMYRWETESWEAATPWLRSPACLVGKLESEFRSTESSPPNCSQKHPHAASFRLLAARAGDRNLAHPSSATRRQSMALVMREARCWAASGLCCIWGWGCLCFSLHLRGLLSSGPQHFAEFFHAAGEADCVNPGNTQTLQQMRAPPGSSCNGPEDRAWIGRASPRRPAQQAAGTREESQWAGRAQMSSCGREGLAGRALMRMETRQAAQRSPPAAEAWCGFHLHCM